MANHRGQEGLVRVGTSAVAELRSWSLDITQDTIEDSTMGDTFRTYTTGMKSWSGQLTCYWDESDTNAQMALAPLGTNAGTATVTLLPEGTSTAATTYSGVVVVTGCSHTASFDGMVEATYSFQGTGTLTKTN
jgi:predicted secreted protein